MLNSNKIFFIITVLFIWFRTNFVFYYYNLFTGKILQVPENLTYPEFLYQKYKGGDRFTRFFARLISCWKCLAFVLAALVTCDVHIFTVYVCSLIGYSVISKLSSDVQ